MCLTDLKSHYPTSQKLLDILNEETFSVNKEHIS